jgi:hypothetical protein
MVGENKPQFCVNFWWACVNNDLKLGGWRSRRQILIRDVIGKKSFSYAGLSLNLDSHECINGSKVLDKQGSWTLRHLKNNDTVFPRYSRGLRSWDIWIREYQN